MENLNGAMKICESLGINNEKFLASMTDFMGAARRQELIFQNEKLKVYRDFAHAPSKVRATVSGFREQFQNQKLTAFLEIHTFSSLNKDFLPQYEKSMNGADSAYVFYNPEVVKHKKLPALDKDFILKCFDNKSITILDDKLELELLMKESMKGSGVLLLMSSGNFGGIDLLR